jgi:hypothetical protein
MAVKPEVPDSTPRSPWAAWGLACGIIGAIGAIPFVPQLEYVFAPAAIILGVLGLRDVSRGMRGKGTSLAALALGVLTIAFKIAVDQGVFAWSA